MLNEFATLEVMEKKRSWWERLLKLIAGIS